MKKKICAIMLTLSLMGGTVLVHGSADEPDPGEVISNPWVDLFTETVSTEQETGTISAVTTAQENTTKAGEVTTEPAGSEMTSVEVTSAEVTSTEVTSTEVTSAEAASTEAASTEVISSEITSSEKNTDGTPSTEVRTNEATKGATETTTSQRGNATVTKDAKKIQKQVKNFRKKCGVVKIKAASKKKSAKKVKIVLKKKLKAVDGLCVKVYKTKKNAKNNKKVIKTTYVKNKKVIKIVVKKQKKLYIKICGYKKIGKVKFLSNKWSKVKKVNIKK